MPAQSLSEEELQLSHPSEDHRRKQGVLWKVLKEQPRGWQIPLFAGVAGVCLGWDIGYIGSLLELKSFQEDVNSGHALTAAEAGLLVSIQAVGCVFASLPCVTGVLLEKLGRRGMFIASGIVLILATVIQATSLGVVQMCVGRFILGLPTGFFVVTPLYQAEVAPKETRGAMMAFFPLGLAFGIFAATACDFGFQSVSHGWQFCVWPMAIFGASLAIGMLFCPESPRHLLSVGKEEKALEALKWLRHGASEGYVEEEWALMKAEGEAEREIGQPSYKALLSGFMGRLLGVACVGWLLFQFSGMTAFTYFGPRMFMMARINAFAFQMVTSGIGFAMVFPSLWIVDRCGRKPLLKWGAACMATSMFGLGFVGTTSIVIPQVCPGHEERTACAHSIGFRSGEVKAATQAAIMFFTLTFVVAYSLTWGVVMNVFANEIFPLKFRSRAVAVGALASWTGNFLMGQFLPLFMDAVGFSTFVVLGFIDVLCVCYACWIPETSQKYLEELVAIFEQRLGVKYNEDQTSCACQPSN